MRTLLFALPVVVSLVACGNASQSEVAAKKTFTYNCSAVSKLNPEGDPAVYPHGFTLTLDGKTATIVEASNMKKQVGTMVVPNRLKKYGDSYEQFVGFPNAYNSYTIIEKSMLLKGAASGNVKVRTEGHDGGWYEDYSCAIQ